MNTQYFAAAALAAAGLVLTVTGCTEQRPVSETSLASPPTTGEAARAPAGYTARAGVIEVQMTYVGAPVVETIRINKDVEQCGTEATNPKILVGEEGGLVYADVSVAGLDGPTIARAPQIDQRGCQSARGSWPCRPARSRS